MKIEDVDDARLEIWSVDEVQAALDAQEIVLIDVRTPQEFMVEHIEGAFLMPLVFFAPTALPGQSDKRIVFHCGAGPRSDRVARMAIDAGVTPVAWMEGGFGAWKAAGKPYIGTDMATGAPVKKG